MVFIIAWLRWRYTIVYDAKYQITDVAITYKNSSITEEAQNQITTFIEDSIQEQSSYFLYRYWNRSSEKKKVQKTFHIINTMEIVDFTNNKITIQVDYHKPHIIRKLPNDKRFWSYQEYLFPLRKEYVGANIALLYLPGYLSNLQSLEGIYHLTSEKELIKLYHTVNEKIPLKHMIVYPWAWYVAMMTVDNLKILFSQKKPIEDQMKLYDTIYKNYSSTGRIVQIDLGSLDDAIVTLK